MIVPPFLTPGKTVGIIAPGRKVSVKDLDAAVQAIESWGLKVIFSKHIFSDNHSYLAGTDEERLYDIQAMLNDRDVAAIICARGGYGTTRFVDRLDFYEFLKHPKWLVGFSDVTALHLHIFKQGVESIHGIMPILFGKIGTEPSVESLHNVLWGKNPPIIWNTEGHNRSGKAIGQVIGGNLSLVVDSIGTTAEPETKDKILVLEEVEEYRYKIDRMMNQLKRAGKLKNLAGLVIGHMTTILDTELSFGETVEEIIFDKVKEYNYPVAFGFPSGHEQPNIAWRHGSKVSLAIDGESSVMKNID